MQDEAVSSQRPSLSTCWVPTFNYALRYAQNNNFGIFTHISTKDAQIVYLSKTLCDTFKVTQIP